ncbi:MAG: hypothetical protein MUF08_10930, partial [Burkholderiaceae bacterium]|nr:hypothetical protein [Burkholderiaceae bacterium]
MFIVLMAPASIPWQTLASTAPATRHGPRCPLSEPPRPFRSRRIAPELSVKEPSAGFGELALVEVPGVELSAELGWRCSDLLNGVPGPQ